jgi:hypothetical protein
MLSVLMLAAALTETRLAPLAVAIEHYRTVETYDGTTGNNRGHGFLDNSAIRAGLADKRLLYGLWVFELSELRPSFFIGQPLNLNVRRARHRLQMPQQKEVIT